ncbi:MAG: helix-turn-helix domain-containing protein [Eubacterium sp.]|nr:helix-turn-helix domain-containing protein [Eubacterium sp.]
MKWQDKVNDLMKERGINQKQLSQLSGITESSISRYLNGSQRPRIDIIINIAEALHVETDYFLEDKEKSESAYNSIATAIARKGSELTPDETNRLIELIIKAGKNA